MLLNAEQVQQLAAVRKTLESKNLSVANIRFAEVVLAELRQALEPRVWI